MVIWPRFTTLTLIINHSFHPIPNGIKDSKQRPKVKALLKHHRMDNPKGRIW